MTSTLLVAAAIAVPALLFTFWPLLRRRGVPLPLLPLPADARQQLMERKAGALRALRELEFEHGAGHVSDADHLELRARYEAETAAILTELDRLGPAPAPRLEPAPPPVVLPRAGWRHPAALAGGAVTLVVFGVVLGVGIVRYTEPDPMAGIPPTGSRPLATLVPSPPDDGTPAAGEAAPRTLSPEMLQGMLQAARSSLFEGHYQEAIAAYRAVLNREPDNVDAMTHLALIVAIGGHAEAALETFDRALAIDPDYPPALLYRGQVLLEAKQDTAGAIQSWERFVAVVPAGEERDRVTRLIAETRTRPARPATAR